MEQQIYYDLSMEEIPLDDIQAIEKIWGKHSNLKAKGRISVETFISYYECGSIFSAIQNGKRISNFYKIELDKPFLVLTKPYDTYLIWYVSDK